MRFQRWTTRADLVLALVCVVVGQVEVALWSPDPVLAFAAALATMPVAWRRHAPFLGMVAITVSSIIVHVRVDDEEPFFFLATLLVFYSLTVHRNAIVSLAGAAMLLGGLAVTVAADVVFLALQLGLVWLAGRGVRAYRKRSDQLRVLTARMERERDYTELLAISQERQRMAAELHDTVSHAVGVMMIQAGGAEQIMDAEPDRARIALIAVQDAGRRAIAELHRVLRLLRGQASFPAAADLPPPQPEPRAWWSRLVPHSAWGDVLFAVLLVGASDAYLYLADPASVPDSVVIVTGEVLAVVAIAIRRQAPVTALGIAAAAIGAELLIVGDAATPAPLVATMVTMYWVAANALTRRAITAIVVVAVSLCGIALYRASFDGALVGLFWLAIPWISARMVLAHRRQVEQLNDVSTRLIREGDARTRLAVLEERARVARELHDSVAHAVSVMVLQAGAAEQVLDAAPEASRTAIRVVADQGRQAHHDLRRLLGLLAHDAGGTPATPPGLARLDILLSQVARAGLPVTLTMSGEPVELPTGLDISAYRIVQEGLTNTLKHAGKVSTTVAVDYRPDTLTVEVRDIGGVRSPHTEVDGGHGLVGMRERVELYGGTLETGPRADGGYTVRARIPLHRVTT